MARTATALTISTTPSERRMIREYAELTGGNPTRLVRRLVFARLPHIIAALKELKAAGLDPGEIPDFDFTPMPASAEQIASFYREDPESWPVKE